MPERIAGLRRPFQLPASHKASSVIDLRRGILK
jgi:hypothetical protein